MMNRMKITWLTLLLLFVAVGAMAQTPIEIEAGYRWLDVNGSNDMYRTQINENGGFVLRSLFLSSNEGGGLADQFRIDGSDLGAGPAGSLRIQASKGDLYRLRIGYRQADAFSALPTLANPFLSQGIVPGQHTWDRSRTMFDADLELMPGRTIVPFIGYSYSKYTGPGTSTYYLGGDEFHIGSNLDENEKEIRGGVAFNTGMFYGQLTQGWRDLHSDETYSILRGGGAGNNTFPVLETPIGLDRFNRASSLDVKTPFTNAFVTADVLPKLRLVGNFSRFSADGDGFEDETSAGSFVSFPLQRFFAGLQEQADSRAKNTTWRTGLRAEYTIVNNIDAFASYQKESRELTGTALVESLYVQSITFGGLDRRNLTELLDATSSIDRDEDVLEAGVAARAIGPLSVRAAFRQTNQDLTVAPDLAEIVTNGSQGGDFERKINTLDVSANLGWSGLTLGAAVRRDSTDDTVLRTDFLDRTRTRLRAAYAFPRNIVRLGLTAEETAQDNVTAGIGFDGKVRSFSGDAEVSISNEFRVRGAYSQFQSDSSILFRNPENFTIGTSRHKEDGASIEGGFSLALSPVTLEAGAARFENEGTTPFDIDRLNARVVFNVYKNTGLAAEWARDQYSDTTIALSNYDASRYGLYLRWRQ